MVVEGSLAQYSRGHQSARSQAIWRGDGLRESPLRPREPIRLPGHEPRVTKRRNDPQGGLRVAAGQRHLERLPHVVLLLTKPPPPWLSLGDEADPRKLRESHDPVAMPAQQLILRAGMLQ